MALSRSAGERSSIGSNATLLLSAAAAASAAKVACAGKRRIDEHRDALGLGDGLDEQLEHLAVHAGAEASEAGHVAPGAAEIGDQGRSDRIADEIEHDRYRGGRGLRGNGRWRPGSDDQVELALDRLGGDRGEPLAVAFVAQGSRR
jgi:hypothetical protein